MKYMKSILIVGAVVLAGLTLSMLAPKAAHAIAATAVQLMNTTADPVPVDEDNFVRHAVTLQCAGDNQFCMTNGIPSGRFVGDFVYIYSTNPSGTPNDVASLSTTSIGGQDEPIMIPLTPNAKGTLSTAVMPIKMYIGSLSNIQVDCGYNPDIPGNFGNPGKPGKCMFTLVGHAVTP
jgi:hypothetical protein